MLGGVAVVGVLGRPFIDLEPWLDLTALAAVHEEICIALAQLPTGYTGGSHRSMQIVAPSRAAEVGTDYGEVIAAFSDDEFAVFRSLADDPSLYTGDMRARSYGEEREVPLSRTQMLWLEAKHGVYFPWKVFYQLMPIDRWEDKDRLDGKRFTREAETFLPNTLRLLRSLPLRGIGRANILGLRSGDHGTVHRDGEAEAAPAEFVMLCPAGNKELFVWDEDTRQEHVARSRAFWFNDADYHGVRPAPHFRYSLRVDGPFTPELRSKMIEPAT